MDNIKEFITDDFEEAAIWFSKLQDSDKKIYLEKLAQELFASETGQKFKRKTMRVMYQEDENGKISIVEIIDK